MIKSYEKVAVGQNWAWQRGDWISPNFAFLEERPWTPIDIGGDLAFVASDTAGLDSDLGAEAFETARWCVAWGDETSDWYSDIHSLTELYVKPIFVARVGKEAYCVVWWRQRSKFFLQPISLIVGSDHVSVTVLDADGHRGEPVVIEKWIEV